MLSLAVFTEKWLGQRIDYDGAYGYQCVDIIKQYLDDCFGMKPGAWGHAKAYWENPHPEVLKKFSKISKTKTPQAGDIIVYTPTPQNSFGHIAIALSSSTMLDQNGGGEPGATGQARDKITKRNINFSRVYGYLRPKDVQFKDMPDKDDVNDFFALLKGLPGQTGVPTPAQVAKYTKDPWQSLAGDVSKTAVNAYREARKQLLTEAKPLDKGKYLVQ